MKRLPAFSLIEVAIGLFIVGLLLMAVMKGTKLVDTAKVHTCVQQIAEIKRDFESYVDGLSNGAAVNLGDFKLASERPALGGKFRVIDKDGGHVVVLDNGAGQGILSPHQVKGIKRYFPEAAISGCDLQGNARTCLIEVHLG